MKTHATALITMIALLAACSPSSAQTTYDGSGRIDEDGNWDNGVPSTAGNPGTINTADGGQGAFRSGTYFITQNGGDLKNTYGGNSLSAGEWTMHDGNIISGNGFSLKDSQIFVHNGGSITCPDDFSVSSGATYTMNGGTNAPGDDVFFNGGSIIINNGVITSDAFNAATGGDFTIAGGTITANSFGTTLSYQDGGQTFNFNGGTISVSGNFGLFGDTNPNTVAVGGSNVGSLTAAGIVGTSYTMNWLPGTKMTMTLGTADWAETAWNADRLLFNGQTKTALGGMTWAEATSVGGLDGSSHFAFEGTTLSLVTVLTADGTVITVR